jgi:hypothetical protein
MNMDDGDTVSSVASIVAGEGEGEGDADTSADD